MISESDVDLKWVSHMSLKGQYAILARDNNLGIQMETWTNRDSFGFAQGKPRSFFFIDKDDREFHSLEDVVDAYNEKFKFSEENPEDEIVYVKIIRKRRA